MTYEELIYQMEACTTGKDLKAVADMMIVSFWFDKSITQDEYLKLTATYCETWKSLF